MLRLIDDELIASKNNSHIISCTAERKGKKDIVRFWLSSYYSRASQEMVLVVNDLTSSSHG